MRLSKGERYLVYDFERRAYPLSPPMFTVGRDAASDLVLREPTVSRTHARVLLDGEAPVLESVGSTGTRVNGREVLAPLTLQNGDRISIGTAVFTVSGAVPTGYSLVDRARSIPAPADPETRRNTIRNPLLHARRPEASHRPGKLPWVMVTLLLLAVAALVFLRG